MIDIIVDGVMVSGAMVLVLLLVITFIWLPMWMAGLN